MRLLEPLVQLVPNALRTDVRVRARRKVAIVTGGVAAMVGEIADDLSLAELPSS